MQHKLSTGAGAASGVDKKKVFSELESMGRTDQAISEDLGPRMAEAEELYAKLGGAGGKADADRWYVLLTLHAGRPFMGSLRGQKACHFAVLSSLVTWPDLQPKEDTRSSKALHQEHGADMGVLTDHNC